MIAAVLLADIGQLLKSTSAAAMPSRWKPCSCSRPSPWRCSAPAATASAASTAAGTDRAAQRPGSVPAAATLAPRSITNSVSTRRRAWFRSLCAISTETSLPLQRGDHLGEPLRERRRDAFERLVEQQQARADGERARQRDQLLLAAREQQRAPRRASRAAPAARGRRARAARPRRSAAADPDRHQDVLLDRQLGHEAAVLRHVADAERGARVRAAARAGRGRRSAIAAAARREVAHDGCASASSCRRRCGRRGRPCAPLGTSSERPRSDLHRLDRDVQRLDLQHRRYAVRSSPVT